jgi:hypothetical protein
MEKYMPFKSKAQLRLLFAKERSGEIKKGTAEKWAHETKNIKNLPNRKAKGAKRLAYAGKIGKNRNRRND